MNYVSNLRNPHWLKSDSIKQKIKCIVNAKFGSKCIFVYKVTVVYFNCKKLLLMNDCSLMVTSYISESIILFLSTKEAELKVRANASS